MGSATGAGRGVREHLTGSGRNWDGRSGDAGAKPPNAARTAVTRQCVSGRDQSHESPHPQLDVGMIRKASFTMWTRGMTGSASNPEQVSRLPPPGPLTPAHGCPERRHPRPVCTWDLDARPALADAAEAAPCAAHGLQCCHIHLLFIEVLNHAPCSSHPHFFPESQERAVGLGQLEERLISGHKEPSPQRTATKPNERLTVTIST